MAEKDVQDRIEINPQVMLGKPVIRGTRITVEIILEKLAADRTIEDILADYPHLEREDVLAALAYARQALGTDEIIPQNPYGLMRLLADENIEAGIVSRLREKGHDVHSVAERTPSVPDEHVLMTAVKEARILVTNDKDFAALAFLQGKLARGIILLRMPKLATEAKATRLVEVTQEPEERFAAALTVIEAEAVRRRRFPSRTG